MALSDDSTLKVREAGNIVSKLCLKYIQKQAIEHHTQGTSHKAAATTAALHHMPNVFLPNLAMARIESENAARLHSRAAVPAPNAHKYTLHRYLGRGTLEVTFTRTTEVLTASIKATAIRSPANRRLTRTRRRRTVPATEAAFRSATMVNPVIRPATSVTTARRMEYAMKLGLFSGPSISGSKVESFILVHLRNI